MKKVTNYLFAGVGLFLVGIVGVNAKTMAPTEIENRSYVIGKYVFTRNTNDNYNGILTTKLIMKASKTIAEEDEEIIYYKNPKGEWVDALSEAKVTPPTTFDVNYVDMEVSSPSLKDITLSNLSVDYNEEGNATVSWLENGHIAFSENPTTNAKYGTVYYMSENEDGPYEKISTNIIDDSSPQKRYGGYVDFGKHYFFKARNEYEDDQANLYGNFSNILEYNNAELVSDCVLNITKNPASNNKYDITLSNYTQTNATSFELLRFNENGNYETIYTFNKDTETHYEDTLDEAEDYYYKIKLVNDSTDPISEKILDTVYEVNVPMNSIPQMEFDSQNNTIEVTEHSSKFLTNNYKVYLYYKTPTMQKYEFLKSGSLDSNYKLSYDNIDSNNYSLKAKFCRNGVCGELSDELIVVTPVLTATQRTANDKTMIGNGILNVEIPENIINEVNFVLVTKSEDGITWSNDELIPTDGHITNNVLSIPANAGNPSIKHYKIVLAHSSSPSGSPFYTISKYSNEVSLNPVVEVHYFDETEITDSMVVLNLNDYIPFSNNQIKTGYIFNGWYLDQNGTIPLGNLNPTMNTDYIENGNTLVYNIYQKWTLKTEQPAVAPTLQKTYSVADENSYKEENNKLFIAHDIFLNADPNVVDGVELYEKIGNTFTLIADLKDFTDANKNMLSTSVFIENNTTKTYKARFYIVNSNEDKLYGPYSDELDILSELPLSMAGVSATIDDTDITNQLSFVTALRENDATLSSGYSNFSNELETYQTNKFLIGREIYKVDSGNQKTLVTSISDLEMPLSNTETVKTSSRTFIQFANGNRYYSEYTDNDLYPIISKTDSSDNWNIEITNKDLIKYVDISDSTAIHNDWSKIKVYKKVCTGDDCEYIEYKTSQQETITISKQDVENNDLYIGLYKSIQKGNQTHDVYSAYIPLK